MDLILELPLAQSYTPALHALLEFKPKVVVASTYQAVSGAGKVEVL